MTPATSRETAEALVEGAGVREARMPAEMREALDWLVFVLGPQVRASYAGVADLVDALVYSTLGARWPEIRVDPDEWTRRSRRLWPADLRRFVHARASAGVSANGPSRPVTRSRQPSRRPQRVQRESPALGRLHELPTNE
jgi:hypothetical protein